eukprot:GAHX01002388.1.p1 GENE.GAHX01002388.1~~GAHX01002388.1.p1  ORF type:complete len:3172 (-),score=674.57 GAHX01002388.1:36-9551(-)
MKKLKKYAHTYDEYSIKQTNNTIQQYSDPQRIHVSIDCHDDLDVSTLLHQYFIELDTNQIIKVPGPLSKLKEQAGAIIFHNANNLPIQSFIALLSTINTFLPHNSPQHFTIIITLFRTQRQRLDQYLSLVCEEYLIKHLEHYNFNNPLEEFNKNPKILQPILNEIINTIKLNEVKLGIKLSHFKLKRFVEIISNSLIATNPNNRENYLTESDRLNILYMAYMNFIVSTNSINIQESIIKELCDLLRLDSFEVLGEYRNNFNYLIPTSSAAQHPNIFDKNLIVTASNKPLIYILNKLVKCRVNIILSGDQGIGKTAIIEALAKYHNKKLFIYNCNIQSCSEDILKHTNCKTENKENNTKKAKVNERNEYISLLEMKIREGNWILFDEANLAEKSFFDSILSYIRNNKTIFFLSLNPPKPSNTSAVKKDIDESLKQYFVNVQIEDKYTKEEIKEIITVKYLQDDVDIRNKNSIIFDRCIDFYLYLRSFDMLKSSFVNIRTLLRCFEYVKRLLQSFNFENSIHESFCCFFITQINPKLLYRDSDGNYQNKNDFITNFELLFKEFNINKLRNIEVKESSNFIITENIKNKINEVGRVVKTNKYPILLEGETSAGKTSIVQHLSVQQKQPLFKINNHIDSDINDYFGGYSLNSGNVVFSEGNFIKCVKNGDWVLLDELNLAPSDFLESLNRLLDNNRTLTHPDTNEVIKAHQNFLLFSTINPSSNDYLGRNKLSDAFKSRFITIYYESLSDKDITEILTKQYSLPSSFSSYLVAVKNKINLLHLNLHAFGCSNKVGFRELSRISKRTPKTWYELILFTFRIMSSKLETSKDRTTIFSILNNEAKVKLDYKNNIETNDIDDMVIKSFDREQSDKIKAFLERKGFVTTKQTLKLFHLILSSYYNKEAVLLTGPTSKGKTSICLLIAEFINKELLTINCHADTESSDFIGRTKPIKENFVWKDGILTKALKEGHVLLIDEINMADTSVIERINSVFDTPPNLSIYESSKNEKVKIHNECFLIATMNPSGDFGKKELSLPLRNRFREIYFDWKIDQEFIDKLIDIKIENNNTKIIVKQILIESCIEEICLRKTNRFFDLIKTIKIESITKELLHFLFNILTKEGHGNQLNEQMLQLNDNKELLDIIDFKVKLSFLNVSFRVKDNVILDRYNFTSETVSFNLFKFILALNCSKSILIEGLPASGKSSLVENFCKLTDVILKRVNLSENTEFVDLVGKEVPCTVGRKVVFKWINGCLLEAMQKGHWLLLDEINLAQQNVLEGLNSVLDHRRSIYISDLNKEFKCHKDFKIIATQNPHSVKGRKGLPKSFINRFVHIYFKDLTQTDIKEILVKKLDLHDDRSVIDILQKTTNKPGYCYSIRDYYTYFRHGQYNKILEEKQNIILNKENILGFLISHRFPILTMLNKYKQFPLHYDIMYNLIILQYFTSIREPLLIKTNSTILCNTLLKYILGKTTDYDIVEGNSEIDLYDFLGKYDTNEDDRKEENSAPRFVFKEGVALKAIKNGRKVIINNIEYVENDVLDKFNGVLENTEPERTFEHLNEEYKVHKDFNIFFITEVNEPETALSSALRSRCNECNIYFKEKYIEKYVDFYLKQKYTEYKHLASFYNSINTKDTFKDKLNIVLQNNLRYQLDEYGSTYNGAVDSEITAFYCCSPNSSDSKTINSIKKNNPNNIILESIKKNNLIDMETKTSESSVFKIVYQEIEFRLAGGYQIFREYDLNMNSYDQYIDITYKHNPLILTKDSRAEITNYIKQNNILRLIKKLSDTKTKKEIVNQENIIEKLNGLELYIKRRFNSDKNEYSSTFDIFMELIGLLYSIQAFSKENQTDNINSSIFMKKSFYRITTNLLKAFTFTLIKKVNAKEAPKTLFTKLLHEHLKLNFNLTIGIKDNMDFKKILIEFIDCTINILQGEQIKAKIRSTVNELQNILIKLNLEINIRKGLQYNQYPNCIIYDEKIKNTIKTAIRYYTIQKQNFIDLHHLLSNGSVLKTILDLKEKLMELTENKKEELKKSEFITTKINNRIKQLRNIKNIEDEEIKTDFAFYKDRYNLTKKSVILHSRYIQNNCIDAQQLNFLFNTAVDKKLLIEEFKITEFSGIQNQNLKVLYNSITDKYITTNICNKLLYIKTPLVSYLNHKKNKKSQVDNGRKNQLFTMDEILNMLARLNKITQKEVRMLNKLLKALSLAIFNSFDRLQYFNRNFYYKNNQTITAVNFVTLAGKASNFFFFKYLESNKQTEFNKFKKEVTNLVNTNSFKYKYFLNIKEKEEIAKKIKNTFGLIMNSVQSKFDIFIAKLNTYNKDTFNESIKNMVELFNSTFVGNTFADMENELKGKHFGFVIKQLSDRLVNNINYEKKTMVKSKLNKVDNIENILNFISTLNSGDYNNEIQDIKQEYGIYKEIKVLGHHFSMFKDLIQDKLRHKKLQNYKTKILDLLKQIQTEITNTEINFTDYISLDFKDGTTKNFILKEGKTIDSLLKDIKNFYWLYNELLTNYVLFSHGDNETIKTLGNELIIKNRGNFKACYNSLLTYIQTPNILFVLIYYVINNMHDILEVLKIEDKDYIIQRLYKTTFKLYNKINNSFEAIRTKYTVEQDSLKLIKDKFLMYNRIVMFVYDEIERLTDEDQTNNNEEDNTGKIGETNEGVGLGEGKGDHFNEDEQIAPDQYNDDLNNGNGNEDDINNEVNEEQQEEVEGQEQDYIEGEIVDESNNKDEDDKDNKENGNENTSEFEEIDDDVVNMENLDIEEKYDELMSNSDDEIENDGSTIEDNDGSFDISITESSSGLSQEELLDRDENTESGEEDIHYNVEKENKPENEIEPEMYEVPSSENNNNNVTTKNNEKPFNNNEEPMEEIDTVDSVNGSENKEDDALQHTTNEGEWQEDRIKDEDGAVDVIKKENDNLEIVVPNYHSIKSNIRPLIHNAFNLFEIALETIHKRKYKGFFKTGKKISLKRIIDYFSSNYTRRTFWLKKVRIPKCNFNINLVIDDSYSLVVNKAHTKVMESFVLLNECFKTLQKNKECDNNSFKFECFKFGETFEHLRSIESLSFNQKTTDWVVGVKELLKGELDSDSKQINIFVTDGRINQSKLDIRFMLENNTEVVNGKRAFFVVLMDSKENTIREVKSVSVTERIVEVKYYLEDFPFEKYVVVEECEELPMKLAQIIMGWLESN